jgi:hypothetical protein
MDEVPFEALLNVQIDINSTAIKMTAPITFLDAQLAQLHDFISNRSASEQTILHVADDVEAAVFKLRTQRARDSLAHSYAISLFTVLLPDQSASIADQLTKGDGKER